MRVHRDGESKRREEDRAFEKRVSEWERHERLIILVIKSIKFKVILILEVYLKKKKEIKILNGI